MASSFEVLVFADRNGQLCAAIERPDGTRTSYVRLNQLCIISVRVLLSFLAPEGADWLEPEPRRPAPLPDGEAARDGDVRTFEGGDV